MIMQNSGTGCLKPFLIPMNDCFNKWIFCCWLGRCNCLSRPQQTQEYVIGVLYLFPLSTSIYLHKNYISFMKLKLCFRQRIENKRHAPFNQRCLFSHFCILLYEPWLMIIKIYFCLCVSSLFFYFFPVAYKAKAETTTETT